MKLNRLTQTFVATAALIFGVSGTAKASLVDLGDAGQFAALALTGGIDDSGPIGPDGSFTVAGDVGVVTSGQKFQASGSVTYSNSVILHSGVGYNSSAKGVPAAQTSPADDALLEQASKDAFAASTKALQLGQNPTATYGTISTATTIGETTKGNYVFNLTGINFSGDKVLTLSAPAGSMYLLNVSDKIALTGGSILVSGGLKASDVLINYTGTSQVQFSGGGNSSVIDGTVLAVNAEIGLHPGLIVGDAIGASITMSSGAQIIGVTPVPEVTPGSMIFGFAGLVVAFGSRKALAARLATRKAARVAA